MGILYVALGGACGAVLRYGVVSYVNRLLAGFPYGTLCVNVVGSFFIGWLMASMTKGSLENLREVQVFLTIGLLGGFTTFSAFSYDALLLFQKGEAVLAIGYIMLSVILSLVAVAIGYYGLRIIQ